MAENTKKDQSAIVALIYVLVIAAFFFGVYKQISALHTNKVQVAAKERQADVMQKNISSLESLSSQLSSQNSSLAKLRLAFPDSAKPEEIIVMLNGMAASSGTSIDGIQPDQDTANTLSSIPAANVSVTVVGDYVAQMSFSKAISLNIRPIIVNSVSLVGQPTSGVISGTYDLGFVTANPVKGGSN